MNKFIQRVNEIDRYQLIRLAIEQREEIYELSANLHSQIQLNRNLIRISAERKNQERKIPAKEPGFRLVKWAEVDQMVSGNMVHCFKLKIMTPYDVHAFDYRNLRLMNDSINENLRILIGDYLICKPHEVRTNISTYSETNWVWGIIFEGDVERDRINLNLFCTHFPQILDIM